MADRWTANETGGEGAADPPPFSAIMEQMNRTKAAQKKHKRDLRRDDKRARRAAEVEAIRTGPFKPLQHPTLYDSTGDNGNVYSARGNKADCAWDQIGFDRDMSPIAWADCNSAAVRLQQARAAGQRVLRPRASPYEHSPGLEWKNPKPMSDFGHSKAQPLTLRLMSAQGRSRTRERLALLEKKAEADFAAAPSSTVSQRVLWSQCGKDAAALRAEGAAVAAYEEEEAARLLEPRGSPSYDAWRVGAACSPDSPTMGSAWTRHERAAAAAAAAAAASSSSSPSGSWAATSPLGSPGGRSGGGLSAGGWGSPGGSSTGSGGGGGGGRSTSPLRPASPWRMDGRARESAAAAGDMFLAGQTRACASGHFLQPSALRLEDTRWAEGPMDGNTWGGAAGAASCSVYPGERKSPVTVTHRNPPGYTPGVSYKEWQPPELTVPPPSSRPSAPRV